MLRKLTLLALAAAMALTVTGVASANGGKSDPKGNAYGHLGFSDGR